MSKNSNILETMAESLEQARQEQAIAKDDNRFNDVAWYDGYITALTTLKSSGLGTPDIMICRLLKHVTEDDLLVIKSYIEKLVFNKTEKRLNGMMHCLD